MRGLRLPAGVHTVPQDRRPVKNSGCLTQMKLKSAHEVVAVRRRVEAARKKAAAEGADVERAAAAVENACPEYEETSS